MHRRMGLAGLATALVTAACGSSSSSPSAAPVAPQTLGVQVDGKTDAFNAAFTAYFPNELTVHPGDTVNFTSVFRGEPHTVMLGSLVTQGLDAYDAKVKAAGSPDEVDDSSIPQLAKIPPLLPDGPGDANQATAQPCFLDSGVDPPGPGATPCPKKDPQPEFRGTESLYNSGFLPDAAVFPVKLSSNLKPGTYRYMCALHRTEMTGKLTVVAGSSAATSVTDAKKTGEDQLQKLVDGLKPSVDQASQTTQAGKVMGGVPAQEVHNALATIFTPKDITVPVGGSVTWGFFGAHTLSFNAPQDATPILTVAPDGGVHANVKAAGPTGNKGVPPPGPPASPSASASASASPSASAPAGPPQVKNVVDLGSYSGTSFWNTGIILSFPPDLTGVKVKFPKAGTYQYKCLVHPDMEGTVKVG